MKQYLTPHEIWKESPCQDFALDVNEVCKKREKDAIIKEVYFTGNKKDEKLTRVYAKVYRPIKEVKGAILFVLPNESEIDTKLLKDACSFGYVAMQIDLYGKKSKGKHTVYPQVLKYCNKVDGYDVAPENALQTTWYQQIKNLASAVEYLQKEESLSDVSVVAVGEGSKLALPLMAICKNLKSGAVLLGSLIGEYVETRQNKTEEEIIVSEQVWSVGIARQSYVPLIKCPVLVVNSIYTNNVLHDQYSQFERLPEGSMFSIIPETKDFIPWETFKEIFTWLEKPWNKNVEISIVDGDEVLISTKAEEPTRLFYTRGKEYATIWYQSKFKIGENDRIRLYAPKTFLQCFALTCQALPSCSNFLTLEANGRYKKHPSKGLLYSSQKDNVFVPIENWWYGKSTKLNIKKGPFQIKGVQGKNFVTYAFGDDKTGLNKVTVFSFDVFSEHKQDLKICLRSLEDLQGYVEKTIKIDDFSSWQHINLAKEDFIGWDDDINYEIMSFECENGILVTNVMAL